MEMKHLEHRNLGLIPELIQDYLDDKPELGTFVNQLPNAFDWEKIAQERSFPKERRDVLIDALLKRYESNNRLSSFRKKTIELLRNDDVFTVTTGHQLNLFTGPAFFFYKIISTIKLAQYLEEEYSLKVIPIYWMASEDHDWDEIKHTTAFRSKINWDRPSEGAVGDMDIAGIDVLFEALCEVLKWDEGHVMRQQFHDWKSGSSTLADFHFKMVNDIFASDELLILDGNDRDLKRCFAPIMKRELVDQVSYSAVNSITQKIKDLNYKDQINPREINLFYLGEKSRRRIEINPEGRFVEFEGERSWTKEEILEELKQHPERFSPNVVLRPLYQEHILPNLAYIGGPGELAYWMQLKSMFEAFSTPFPNLILRNNVLVLQTNVQQKMEKLSLELQDLFSDQERLIAEWSDQKGEVSLVDAARELEQVYEGIIQKALSIDPQLDATVRAALQRQKKELEGLEKRFRKAIKQQEEVSIRQIEGLFSMVFPEGVFQERQQSFFALNELAGGELKQKLSSQLPVLEPGLSVVYV
jgi:bacillithiol biosynthesis cysteine-adding enzyme BshC